MKHKNRRWVLIKRKLRDRVPFVKDYCVCGKRSFTKREAERFRMAELNGRGSKKKAHIYQCPESFDYHLTYQES